MLTNNWTRGAARSHTTTPISHTTTSPHSPNIRYYTHWLCRRGKEAALAGKLSACTLELVGAYARVPAFCWVHCQHAQNGGVLHDLPASQSDSTQLKADLDLDLEHTLDAGLAGNHRVQVWWRSGHLPARRSDLRKSLQTDGRTDGQTTDAAPLH